MNEKVIKGLKCCTKQPNEYGECMSTDCPYKGADCCRNVMADALAILGAQEPVKPHESNGHTGKPIWQTGLCQAEQCESAAS